MKLRIPQRTEPFKQPKALEENIKIRSETTCKTCYIVGREGEDGWMDNDDFQMPSVPASCITVFGQG